MQITTWGGLSIAAETPANRFEIELVDGDGAKICVFGLSADVWYALRKVLPRADDYYMYAMGSGIISDHAKADAYAEQFYDAARDVSTPSTIAAE